jgi:hypothetical protein
MLMNFEAGGKTASKSALLISLRSMTAEAEPVAMAAELICCVIQLQRERPQHSH